MRGGIWILRRLPDQLLFDRVLVNITLDPFKLVESRDPPVRKAFLPNRGLHSKLPASAKGKATLNQLHGSFNRRPGIDRDQNMEMVRHYHEFMQPKFSLHAVVVEHADE